MKTKLLIISLICLFTYFTQEEPLSKVANIKIPVTSLKLSKNEGFEKINKEYKYATNSLVGKKNVFSKNGIIVAFGDSLIDPNNRSLEQIKKQQLELFSQIGGEVEKGIIESKIYEINHIKFYIFKNSFRGEYFYNFTSERNDLTGIYGTVVFKKDMMGEADIIFNNLIKSISFKKL